MSRLYNISGTSDVNYLHIAFYTLLSIITIWRGGVLHDLCDVALVASQKPQLHMQKIKDIMLLMPLRRYPTAES